MCACLLQCSGSTPVPTYKGLVELYKAGKVSFKHVVTFNMDEYCGLPRDHPESYHSFMWENLFKHIDIVPENANILDGNAPNLDEECQRYEEKIRSVGGIELFLAGGCWRLRARVCSWGNAADGRIGGDVGERDDDDDGGGGDGDGGDDDDVDDVDDDER